MRLYVDSAEGGAIERALASGYVFGVTTNPTLLRGAGVRRGELGALVQAAVGGGAQEIHLQVLADTVDEMIRDGERLRALDPSHVVVKVPATSAGFAAGARLARGGVPLTFTAVFSVRQAILAGAAGGRYAAVYLGRIRRSGRDPFALIGEMQDTFRTQAMDLLLLAASVQDPGEIETLARLGVPAATLPPDLLLALPEAPETADAVRAFQEDAEQV